MNPIGPVNALYPMPTTLVGTTVNGKPNFLTIAHVGILNHGTPQYLSLSLGKVHQALGSTYRDTPPQKVESTPHSRCTGGKSASHVQTHMAH